MKFIISIIFALLLSIVSFTGFDTNVYAQDSEGGWGLKDATGARSQYMPEDVANSDKGDSKVSDNMAALIKSATGAVTAVVASIAILFTIINGFLITISTGGDQLGKAKKGLIWSVAGLMLVIFAYIIVKTTISLIYTS